MAILIVLQHTLSTKALEAWGWRIPFVFGAVLAIAVFMVQMRLEESRSYERSREVGGPPSSLTRLFAEHPRETWIIFVLSGAGGLGFYAYTTYMQKFLTNSGHFSKTDASWISAASLVVYLFVIPLFGWLGDRIGRRILIAASFGVCALIVWPVMTALGRVSDPLTAFGLVSALLVALSGYSAVNAVVKAELYPAGIRGLGVALPYALGNAIFGGTAEYVALALKKAGVETAFYGYVAVVLAAGALVAARMRDTQATSLIEDD